MIPAIAIAAILAAALVGTVYLLLRRERERDEARASEQAKLLDRIQAPQHVLAGLMPAEPTQLDPTLAELDEQFMDDPASEIPYDPDLQPMPGDE